MEPTCKPINKDYLTSSLKDFDSEILSKKYLQSNDEQLHTHANEEVLNRLNVSDTGTLLFDGNEIKTDSQAIRQLIDLSYANANTYTDERIAELINGAPSTLDTLKEIADALEENGDVVQTLHDAIGSKTDQADLETVAFSGSYHDLIDKPFIPTNTSQLTNDAGFKSTDNDTWKANTASSEGYVASGADHANQVWKTDANGNPAWRDEAAVLPGTVLEQTLTAGATTLTFTDDAITDDSMIDIYTDPYCTELSAVNQDGNTLTLTFDAQETDMRVCVKVGDMYGVS